MKADTGATAHYFTQSGVHAFVDVEPTKMGLRFRLPDNITMNPEQVGHLPLTFPPDTTENHVFSAFKNTSLISVGQLYDDDFQAIFNKNLFKCWTKMKTSF